MHEIWCLSSDRITREVHPTAQLDVSAGVIGQFLSDYLAENGRRIPILGQICINGSVELLGIPNFHRTSDPMYTENLLAPHDTTGWGDGGNPNQNWPLSWSRNVSVPWLGAVPECRA